MCHTSSFSHDEAEETKEIHTVAKERKMLPSFAAGAMTEENFSSVIAPAANDGNIAEKTLVKEPWGVFCAVKCSNWLESTN